MDTRTFLPGVLAVAIGVSVVAGAEQGNQDGANWTAPRTPWGDPDIQGIFTTDDELGVPFERPGPFGQRTLLTDEEPAERGSTGALRLMERFTRVADDAVRYEVTVTDPATFSRPWTAALSLRTDPDLPDVFEYACHEGNYAMRNIPSAAREADKAGQGTPGR